MTVTKNELLDGFTAKSIPFNVHEHHPVLTADAQVQACATHIQGTVLKNLFLKDKKNRLYILSALPETKIDLKILSVRLGVGKGNLSMAPQELLSEVLQVELGSVTPFAIVNATSVKIILLLDKSIQSVEHVIVHPLVNTTSISLTPDAFGAAIRSLGAEAVYEDFELDPKVDKDNPPDLKKHTDGVEGYVDSKSNGTSSSTASSTAVMPAAAAVATTPATTKKAKAPKDNEAAPKASTRTAPALDVDTCVDSLMKKVEELLGSNEARDSFPRLRADAIASLNALRNVAYASGFVAGQGTTSRGMCSL